MVEVIEIEVSEYLSNQTALIPLNLTYSRAEDITVHLANNAVVSTILLDLYTAQATYFRNFVIECLSQCSIIAVNYHNLHISHLNLTNAAFIQPVKLEVSSFFMQASETVKAALPVVTEQAEIRILPSADMLAVQQLLTGVNIIPGSGEYVYDPKLQFDNKKNPINANNPEQIADSLYNLESLKRAAPNLLWTAPVVSWFGISSNNKLDVSNLNIVPAIEHQAEKVLEPWHVAGYDRSNAYTISKDSENRPNYGGTINDASLVRYIDALKDAGYKVMLYPMIFMDIAGKPWRGYITANDPVNIHQFFTKDHGGYNEFILHYASLLKGKIDAFVIGSELRDLTQVVDDQYPYPDPKRYPTVVELIDLAKRVREILGQKVIITYAADWSEYHHDQNGYHHLDPLWASTYIDVVGIDAYLPLTSKILGDVTIDEIKQGWQSGELWDYYYSGDKKEALSPEWGLKQIEHWWNREHWAWSIKSPWQPKMKPIWFTEFGFPSVHMAPNQPNVFYSPGTIDGGVPKQSSGNPDFALQMRAIRATLEYWQAKSDIVQNMFLWAWDARPYPAFPERLDLWTDGVVWSRGHFINGKIDPISRVTLLPDFNITKLSVYAEELVIPGTSSNSTAKMIIANHVYLQSPLQGTDLGIRAKKIFMQEAINITLTGTLLLDSDNPITFLAHKTVTSRSQQDGEKTTKYYVDETITSPVINVNKLIAKIPHLVLYATKIKANKIEWWLNDLDLISEAETHSYQEEFQGKEHLLTGKANTASSKEQSQIAITTHINCEDFRLQLTSNLYTRGALIETSNFNGYAKNYHFEPLALESSYETCSSKRKWAGFTSSKKSYSSGYDGYLHGAVLLIANQGYAFSENEITFLGSYLMGDEIELVADKISFKAAIGKHFSWFKVEEKGIKFFAGRKDGEIALGIGAYYKSLQSGSYYEQATQAGAFVNKLKLTARVLERDGGVISGGNVTINATEIINSSPVVMSYYHLEQQSLEIGIKIGIQESITKAIAAGQGLLANVGGNNPALVSAVNFVSNNQALFMQLTNIASGNAVQGGIWLYGEAKSKHFSARASHAVTNPINVEELTINAGYWRMQRLEGKGCTWNINVGTIEGEFSEDQNYQEFGNGEINEEFSLYGNVGHGASFQTNAFTNTEASRHTNHITLKDKLYLNSAKVTGALRVEAEDITAIVDVLKLVSAQDERRGSSSAFNAHIGAARGSITGAGVYGEKDRSDSYITSDGRIGFKGRNLLVVKAKELVYLEGAYLDTSSGNLRINATKITTKAITDTATGWTVGLGLDSGNKAFSPGTRVVAGETDQSRTVYGAIGQGVIIIGDQEIDEAMSALLGISRDTGLDELEGKEWKLDATFRRAYADEIKKIWSGGAEGVANRIIDNAAAAVNNVVSPLAAVITATMHVMQQALAKLEDMLPPKLPDVDENSLAEQIHQELSKQSTINGNIDAEISGRNLAIAIIASKLVASGKFKQAEAIDIASKLYKLGEREAQETAIKPVVLQVIAIGARACAASPTCVAATAYGIAAIGASIAYLKDHGAKHIALDELEGYFDKEGDVLYKKPDAAQESNQHKPAQADTYGTPPNGDDFEPPKEDTQDRFSSEQKIQDVIEETLQTNEDSFTSKHILNQDEAMEVGIRWLGKGYKEIGKPGSGVYRSADGLRQFRIDKNSLTGNHAPYEPHVHLEKVLDNGKTIISRNHIIIKR